MSADSETATDAATGRRGALPDGVTEEQFQAAVRLVFSVIEGPDQMAGPAARTSVQLLLDLGWRPTR